MDFPPQRQPRKPAIVFRSIIIEEPVRLLLTANPSQTQLLDQPVMKGAELPLDPTLSLGRVKCFPLTFQEEARTFRISHVAFLTEYYKNTMIKTLSRLRL